MRNAGGKGLIEKNVNGVGFGAKGGGRDFKSFRIGNNLHSGVGKGEREGEMEFLTWRDEPDLLDYKSFSLSRFLFY